MKFEVRAFDEHVMNGVSESDRSRLRRMWFWVKDDLDSSRIIGVHKDQIDLGIFPDVSEDVFCCLCQSVHFCIKV